MVRSNLLVGIDAAAQKDRIWKFILQFQQSFDNAAAIRATIDIVAKEDHSVGRGWGDLLQQQLQQVVATVDVADCQQSSRFRNRHWLFLGLLCNCFNM